MQKLLWLSLSIFLLGGCESRSHVIGRCTIEVEKATTRLSHATEVPSQAQEALARANLELTGTRPSLACREARNAVRLVRKAEQKVAIVYLPIVGDLDYGWSRPSSEDHTWSGSSSPPHLPGSDSSSWSSPFPSHDSGGWSGFSGFGGADSGGWSSGGSSSSGSDAGGW